ncbi:hypothetical protein [Streptomyces sp. NBC_00691]
MGFTALLAQADAEGDLDWVVAVGSTTTSSAETDRWSPSGRATRSLRAR